MERPANPAEAINEIPVGDRKRLPMSLPVARLSVPEIPGYHQHWFVGSTARMQRALQGGYEFVRPEEVALNNRVLGSDTAQDGNTDLGTRVSIVSGDDVGKDGQVVRLYLMKIKEEWWQEDQRALVADDSRLGGIRRALAGGLLGADKESGADKALRYVDQKRTKLPDFLTKKISS